MEILLCEGRDVELRARISKHIFVFAFDPLSLNSLSLSYILHSIILFISYIYLVLFVCLTCVEPREFYIAPQLLFRGDSSELFAGNSVTLFGYTKCVAICF